MEMVQNTNGVGTNTSLTPFQNLNGVVVQVSPYQLPHHLPGYQLPYQLPVQYPVYMSPPRITAI
jgi:hypothetical protein